MLTQLVATVFMFDALQQFLPDVPTYVLVFFRVTGLMLFAPLFGSSRIPRRMKVLLAAVIAMAIVPGVKAPAVLPETSWGLALGIGGEMMFGFAIGMALSFTFIAVQWAGDIIGQQMGLNMSEVMDPQFGAQGSIVGEIYFMLMLVIFLILRGHHAMLRGLRESFDALPLLTASVGQSMLDVLIGLFTAATILAFRLAAPMLVTILVVDLALGFIGKTVPQLNVMTAGLTIRALIGMMVLIVGLILTSDIMRDAMVDTFDTVASAWTTPAAVR